MVFQLVGWLICNVYVGSMSTPLSKPPHTKKLLDGRFPVRCIQTFPPPTPVYLAVLQVKRCDRSRTLIVQTFASPSLVLRTPNHRPKTPDPLKGVSGNFGESAIPENGEFGEFRGFIEAIANPPNSPALRVKPGR